ncbi:MAG TPA: folylpolyglutamate synthase/dihydrofolate synthase family protein [Chthoniobacterales bacterium]|nr:folylpolyglutamate synthase/dihydrofolate synthase family protein [Chthoniobacterales bacterium]
MNAPYNAAIQWLFDTQSRGVKLGLENVRRLLMALDEPQNELRFVHIAGTNGKGSVCAMIDSICRFAGIRTGLFTSPHLIRFNERIQVSGAPINDEAVVDGVEKIRGTIDERFHPTFFEITTALAFDHFRKQNVELVVLETGLGGRLDATNVVHPLVSVLTSIDLDHQSWLGESLAKIATEKGGIIKPGIPAVSAPQFPEVRVALERIADERSAPITFVENPLNEPVIALAGSHQRLNAAVAIAAIDRAAIGVGRRAVRDGLAKVHWPGRFQRFDEQLILDGAHNPSATIQLIQAWEECLKARRATIIFGGLLDKDLESMISMLSRLAARFLVVPVRSKRAASTWEIARFVPKHLPCAQCVSAEEALALARSFEDHILVTGSLFLVGEILFILDPSQTTLETSNQ